MFKEKIYDKWYLIPIIILGIHFIYRIINQSQMISIFPLDVHNDLTSLLAQLFFLAKCGFHKMCPYWYNGYEVLKYYAPGWFYFTLPIYLLTKSVLSAAYISLILMYVLSFIFLIILSKTQKLSLTKTILFFFLFFANPISIGNFIRLGRLHSMFSFMLLIPFVTIILWYKKHKITKNFFYIFIPIYTIILLSHQQETILFHFLILSLFLIKPIKENLKIIVSGIIGLSLASFWLIPFIKSTINTSMLGYEEGKWLLDLSGPWFLTNIASFIIPSILVFVFYFYWRYNRYKDSKELIFYFPILLLSILFLIRLIVFIPLLNQIEPDTYMTFFLFISILLFLKIKSWPFKLKNLIIFILILLSIISISISIFYTPFFYTYTELETNTINILKNVEGKFLILNPPSKTSFINAYYSYAPIYYNLSTSGGWAPQTLSNNYSIILENLLTSFENKNCVIFLNNLNILNTTNIIAYDKDCNILKSCGLKKEKVEANVCLYKIPTKS